MPNTPNNKRQPGFIDNRPHRFDPKTMGKDKKAAGLEYWNRRLNKPTDGSTPTPLTWKQIKASEGYKKGQFNKFYANRPENIRQARDRYEARLFHARKFGGKKFDPEKPMSWKDIKKNKGYKAGSYRERLEKRRKLMRGVIGAKPKATAPPATPPADDEQQS